MRRSNGIHRLSAMIVVVLGAFPSGGLVRAAEPAAKEDREQIGEVLEKPVYRDEIRKDRPLAGELHRLFTQPVMVKYRREHEKEITPSPAEIDRATAYFDEQHRERIKDKEADLRAKLKGVEAELALDDLPAKKRQELERQKRSLEIQLKPPGKQFAEYFLGHWKFQRHLYDKFGGGRILWQQAGTEAFDAMRAWLETQEKAGQFKIADPALRTNFYEYWTTQKHGASLTADKEKIREQFLEPEWARRPAK
ncbi:MAG TPA: hypothetical protein VL475_12975 [Planctomycetaceae bacterium]|jgi:hypothetical protein|nr:hypothetical protein [Planctomycetaceae bacterium]